jgi:hypothetical protein
LNKKERHFVTLAAAQKAKTAVASGKDFFGHASEPENFRDC